MLAACLPLLEESRVEAMEWSFDTLFRVEQVPEWFHQLLHLYSSNNRLIGHGVFFSLFTGRWMPEQRQWLKHLEDISRKFQFEHVTEHFGFMTGKDFHHGAPLTIPYTAATLSIGRDRLARMQQACNCPVGLENLAFAYTLDEVKQHGLFLNELVEPVNGFIILDLHNLYCQLHNFSVGFDDIIQLYPLHRVREIHISGGSWEHTTTPPYQKVRRDTHDDAVPAQVFELLQKTLPLCPNLKYVVMEQLGAGLKTTAARRGFYTDFVKMQGIVAAYNNIKITGASQPFLPVQDLMLGTPLEDEVLYQQQLALSAILETAATPQEAMQSLSCSTLANSDWYIENWHPAMLETAISIAKKWK